ncbi:MAG: serine/threonine-protein kinase [Candidatus Sericytochromatia bacterium]
MAELRTIEKSFDAGILSVTGSILSLPDEYIIIPHLLYTARKFDDYVITILGPNGIFLLSYQMFLTNQEEAPIEDQIIYLREYAVKLYEFFSVRNLKVENNPVLIIVSEHNFPYIHGEADDPMIIPISELKKFITSTKVLHPIPKAKIQEMTYVIRANGSFKRINQYQILSELEYSDSIITYMAYDTVLDRSVLIKEIKNYTNPEELEDLEKNEILREAKLTMQLQHKNIINIEQLIPKDGSLFVVVETFEKSQTLKQMINKSKSVLEPQDAINIILQLCEALEHAHIKGIIHRNVRPENIILTKESILKLTNFDLAKKSDMSTRSTYDLKQMVKENPYAAPEYRLGSHGHHNIDQRVDVYATGVILYELLTNRLPVHLDERYWEAPSKYNLDVTEELDKIILQAIRFDPHQRFATISALKNRLLNIGQEKDESSSDNRYIDRNIFKRTRNSIIFQAYDKKYSRKVALKKVLLDTFLTNQQRKQKLEKLLAEAKIVSKLIHPNIVEVYDYFIEDSDGYIVMEWLEGKTLRELKNEIQVLNIDSIIKITVQIAEALNYAHHQNIMHKDIKPENIMLNKGKITILDFGVATFLEEKDIYRSYGTAIYMAPEQLNNDWLIDQKVDIFSLGVLIYEMLTGRFPYDPSIIMAKYSTENIIKPVPVSEINFACPPILDSILEKALKINPDERYQRMTDFIYDLKTVYRSELRSARSSLDKIKKLIPSLPIPVLAIGLIISFLVIYLTINLIFKDKKETNEVKDITLNMPYKEELETEVVTNEWQSDTSANQNVIIESKMYEYETKVKFKFKINNQSDDEIILLNRIGEPSISLKDENNNEYSQKINIQSISSDLTRIYPKTNSQGSFELSTKLPSDLRRLVLSLKEDEGKNRSFTFIFKRK